MKLPDTSVIIVANKCDLENERQVSTQEGRDLAKQFGCKFIETSAKSRYNVDESFFNLVREIRRFSKEAVVAKPEKSKFKLRCSLM